MPPTSTAFLAFSMAITRFTAALLVLLPVLLSTSSLSPALLRLFPILLPTSSLALLFTAEEEHATIANELSNFELFSSQFTVDFKYAIGGVVIGIRNSLIGYRDKREKREKADEE